MAAQYKSGLGGGGKPAIIRGKQGIIRGKPGLAGGGKSWPRRAFTAVNGATLTIAAAISLLPVIHILSMSLSSNAAVTGGMVGLWPVNFTTIAYNYVLKNPQFFTSFLNSVERAAAGVTVNMIMIVMVAYPMSRSEKQFPNRKYFVWFFIFTMLFNGGLIPTYMVVKTTGLYDSFLALILPGAVPVFNVLILMNFFRDLPKEIEEAAFIDGAGHWTLLSRILLPLSKAALATLVLFCFVEHWNEWFDGMIFIATKAKRPLQTYLQAILSKPDLSTLDPEERAYYFQVNLRSVKAAQIFITITPIMAVYPFLQKYFTKGIVLGSVKG